MCIMTLIPAGVDAPWDGLIEGGLSNPDGHGWAVAQGGTLVVGKSMDLQEAIDDFEKARDDMGGAPLSLFHSRIATAGLVTTYNVHPFYVGGDKRTVMAHNGILPFRYQPDRKKDDRSDTRLYSDWAGDLMNPDNGVPSRRMARRIAADIGHGNKFIFLSVRSGSPVSRIVNAEAGVFTQGVWFSNRSFEKRQWHRPSKAAPVQPSYYDWDEDFDTRWAKAVEQVEAEMAGEKAGRERIVVGSESDFRTSSVRSCLKCRGAIMLGTCAECGTCDDCLAPATECMCFTPRSLFEVHDGRSDDEELQRWLHAHANDEAASEQEDKAAEEWARETDALAMAHMEEGEFAAYLRRKYPLSFKVWDDQAKAWVDPVDDEQDQGSSGTDVTGKVWDSANATWVDPSPLSPEITSLDAWIDEHEHVLTEGTATGREVARRPVSEMPTAYSMDS